MEVMLVLLLIFIIFNYYLIDHDILAPINVFSLVLFLMLCLLIPVRDIWSITLDSHVVLYLVAVVASFNIGCILSGKSMGAKCVQISLDKSNLPIVSNKYLYFIAIINIILMLIYLGVLYRIAAGGGIARFLFVVKMVVSEMEDYVLPSYVKLLTVLINVNNDICAFFLVRRFIFRKQCNAKIKILVLEVLMYLVTVLATAGRFSMICLCFYILVLWRINSGYLHSRNKVNREMIKKLAYSLIGIYSLFLLAGVFTHRFEEGFSFFQQIARYTSSSLYGLNKVFVGFNYDITNFGRNSLGIFGQMLLGTQPYVNRGYYIMSNNLTSNIYTGLVPLLDDFGVVGSLICIVVFGYIFSKKYKECKKKLNGVKLIVFGSLAYLYPCIWININPIQYITSISIILRILLTIMLYKTIERKTIRGRQNGSFSNRFII